MNGFSSSAWLGWKKPAMIERAVMLGSVSSSMTWFQAFSLTAIWGRAGIERSLRARRLDAGGAA